MTELDLMDHLLIARARKLAERAHAGQVDKAGRPYVEHLERVAAAVADHPKHTGLAQAVAWLHDIVEDTPVRELDLMAAAMPAEVIAAVLALTHQRGEPRLDYYARVRGDEIALAVKLADVADNADPQRLALLDDTTRERLERKYALARAALLGVQDSEG